MSSYANRIPTVVTVSRNDTGSDNKRKRKAKTQGGRDNNRVEAPDVSIAEVAWKGLWSDDFETVVTITEALVLLISDQSYSNASSRLRQLADATANGVILLKNIEKSVGNDSRSSFIEDTLLLLLRLSSRCYQVRDMLSATPRAVETLVDAMIFYDARIAERACSILGLVARGNVKFCLKLYDEGTIPLVLVTMESYIDESEVIYAACLLLHHLLLSKKQRILFHAKSSMALSTLALAKDNFPNHCGIRECATESIDILNRV